MTKLESWLFNVIWSAVFRWLISNPHHQDWWQVTTLLKEMGSPILE